MPEDTKTFSHGADHLYFCEWKVGFVDMPRTEYNVDRKMLGNRQRHQASTGYGTPKLSCVVIFLVVLSKNCVNLSMHYVIILKTRVVLSIYSVDMPKHCLKKNHFILSQRGVILSKKHVNLSI